LFGDQGLVELLQTGMVTYSVC